MTLLMQWTCSLVAAACTTGSPDGDLASTTRDLAVIFANDSAAGTGSDGHSSFTDGVGHELIQMGPVARRRVCPATGCRLP